MKPYVCQHCGDIRYGGRREIQNRLYLRIRQPQNGLETV